MLINDSNLSGKHGGGWSRNGCTKAPSNFTHTVCKCHHLTSFAVVSDLRIEVSFILSFEREICVCWGGGGSVNDTICT